MDGARRFGLDAWRALAILLVLAGHASFWFLPLTRELDVWYSLAFLGVELFFVLSGFLIGGILIGEFRSGSFRLRQFWTRRWLRTLPNYFLFLGVNIILYRAMFGAWPQFGLFLVFLQNFAWPHPPLFSEAWSLSIEELFYLIAPLATLALVRLVRGRGSVLGWLLAAIALVTAIRIGYVLWRDPLWDSGVRKIALLRLDTDWYESTKLELEVLFPRLIDGGILLIDDFGDWEGSQKATVEYFENNKVRLLLNKVDRAGRICLKV